MCTYIWMRVFDHNYQPYKLFSFCVTLFVSASKPRFAAFRNRLARALLQIRAEQGEGAKIVSPRLPRRVPKRLLQFLLVLGCLYIMSGGFYNQIIKPTQYVLWRGNWYTIHPDMGDQTTLESTYAFFCNVTTFLGLWIVHLSSTGKRSRLTSDRLMLIGIGLMVIGISGSYYLVEMKRMSVPVG